jgi:hypothetical protein
VFGDRLFRSSVIASIPPADAPIPTIIKGLPGFLTDLAAKTFLDIIRLQETAKETETEYTFKKAINIGKKINRFFSQFIKLSCCSQKIVRLNGLIAIEDKILKGENKKYMPDSHNNPY